jgi:hypothetical protein
MPQVKRAAKGKRPNKAVSVLGIAGVSLAASTGGSPADIPPASLVSPAAGSVANLLWQDAAPFRLPTLDEEEIFDVSLATFRLFDKDDLGSSQSGVQLAFRGGCGGGCGCGHGCGGGFRGCGGGFHGCGGGFRGCGGGFRGCGVGFRGCRGCGVGFGGCGCGGGCGGCGWGWGWGGGCCLSWGGCALC